MDLSVNAVNANDPMLRWRASASPDTNAQNHEQAVQDTQNKVNATSQVQKRPSQAYAQEPEDQGASTQLLDRILQRSRNLLQQQEAHQKEQPGLPTKPKHAAEAIKEFTDVSIMDESVRGASSQLLDNILEKAGQPEEPADTSLDFQV